MGLSVWSFVWRWAVVAVISIAALQAMDIVSGDPIELTLTEALTGLAIGFVVVFTRQLEAFLSQTKENE